MCVKDFLSSARLFTLFYASIFLPFFFWFILARAFASTFNIWDQLWSNRFTDFHSTHYYFGAIRSQNCYKLVGLTCLSKSMKFQIEREKLRPEQLDELNRRDIEHWSLSLSLFFQHGGYSRESIEHDIFFILPSEYAHTFKSFS